MRFLFLSVNPEECPPSNCIAVVHPIFCKINAHSSKFRPFRPVGQFMPHVDIKYKYRPSELNPAAVRERLYFWN